MTGETMETGLTDQENRGPRHTLGPWEVDAQNKDAITILNNQAIVAVTNTRFRNYEANARLIAAAPELLEALRPLAYLADILQDGHVLNFQGAYITAEQAQAARAAIAAATGETP